MEEKRTGSLNFGAGFSTIDKLVGFVEMSQGNFDILNWPNFTGAGQKFRVRIQYGSSRKDVTLSLTEPYFLDRRLSLGGEIFYREADYLSNIYTSAITDFPSKPGRPIAPFVAVSLAIPDRGDRDFQRGGGVFEPDSTRARPDDQKPDHCRHC